MSALVSGRLTYYDEVAQLRRSFEQVPRPGEPCIVFARITGRGTGPHDAICLGALPSGRLRLAVLRGSDRPIRLITDPSNVRRNGAGFTHTGGTA